MTARTIAAVALAAAAAALAAAGAAAPTAVAGARHRHHHHRHNHHRHNHHRAGTISGVVTFKGTPPPRKPLDRRADAFCARTKQLSEKVVVTDGKLEGVLVRIAGGAAAAHAAPKTPVIIRQKDCMYRPRVVGIMVGQPLEIVNGDPTMHNVHAYVSGRSWFNFAQPPTSPPIKRANPGKAGDVITLKCDVHHWMRAYAVVSSNPYFAVTGKGGRFSIEGVPHGTYTLVAWHPVLGRKTTTVTVGKDGATAQFTFP